MGKKTDTLKKAATPVASTVAALAPTASGAKKLVRKAPATAAGKTARPQISGEDVALRAYFIAEKRQRERRSGDSQSDWLEAERQLLAELSGKKSAAAKSKAPAKPTAV